MQASAFQITYVDDRDAERKLRTTTFVTPGQPATDAVPALFQARTTPRYGVAQCLPIPLSQVDTLERSMALDAFAKTLGIAILDREDETTTRSMLESRFDLEVTDEMIAAALDGVRANAGSIPLVTEFESGQTAVADAMLQGLRDAELIQDEAPA